MKRPPITLHLPPGFLSRVTRDDADGVVIVITPVAEASPILRAVPPSPEEAQATAIGLASRRADGLFHIGGRS